MKLRLEYESTARRPTPHRFSLWRLLELLAAVATLAAWLGYKP